MASRDGSLWIAEPSVLIHRETTGLSFYEASQGLPGNSPTSLFEDSRGRLWVGVDLGLAWREHGRFFQLRMPDGSAVGFVRTMAEDRDGNLWAATIHPSRSLLRVRDGRVIEVFSVERIGGEQITAMAADPEGGLWIGLVISELKRYRNGRIEPHGKIANPEGRCIYSLLPDARGLWVVTNQGLGLLRNGTLSTLDTRNGLPCDVVEDAIWGDDGTLWLKTACGLVQIPAGELDAWSGNLTGAFGSESWMRSTARKPLCLPSLRVPRSRWTAVCGLRSKAAGCKSSIPGRSQETASRRRCRFCGSSRIARAMSWSPGCVCLRSHVISRSTIRP